MYIAREPRSQHSILPREPRGQAMAVSRGSCRERAPQRPRTLHPGSPRSSHVHPHPRGPPACEKSLPWAALISGRKSRSKSAVRFCFTRLTTTLHGTYSPSKNYGQDVVNASNLFDLITYQQQEKLAVIPGSKRSNVFWADLIKTPTPSKHPPVEGGVLINSPQRALERLEPQTTSNEPLIQPLHSTCFVTYRAF